VRPVVAVVPFGAVVEDPGAKERAGRWARQIARRLVERFGGEAGIDLRPVFLVAMPGSEADAGYLVFGSTPDPKLAAEYGRGLGASHALSGTYREHAGGRRLEAALVDAASERVLASFERDIEPEELHLVEPALAVWLAETLAVRTERDLTIPASAGEGSYAPLLAAMDAEVDATLLRESDPKGSANALRRASASYMVAASADPTSVAIEERILVMAAAAIEHDQQPLVLEPLEILAETRPSSWRVQYMLGEVRRTGGDVNGAIVAFEHADALHPLRPEDAIRLARLHITAGAPAVAASRLRRVLKAAVDPAATATARRLLLGLWHPDLERDLEEAGKIAVDADVARSAEAETAFERVLATDPDLWEAHFGRGLLAWQRGDADAAQASFQRAIDLNPGAAELLSDLGKAVKN
jgi:tetratricopeptide (TPR) repeat protein